ncbi:MAG: hypothetical protein LBT80_03245 [Lactobacillaceae bacterium]|nr:hypothetical protein [Lactobacillaceae bacterium]
MRQGSIIKIVASVILGLCVFHVTFGSQPVHSHNQVDMQTYTMYQLSKSEDQGRMIEAEGAAGENEGVMRQEFPLEDEAFEEGEPGYVTSFIILFVGVVLFVLEWRHQFFSNQYYRLKKFYQQH